MRARGQEGSAIAAVLQPRRPVAVGRRVDIWLGNNEPAHQEMSR